MVDAPLRFLYVGVRVRDLERSIRFYTRLGMKLRARGKMDHGGEYVHLAFPRSPMRLELNYYPKGNRFFEPFGPGSEFDHLGFYSPEPDRQLAKMVDAGGRVAIPTWDETHSRIGYVNDPDGVTLEVFGPRPTAKPKRKTGKRRRRA